MKEIIEYEVVKAETSEGITNKVTYPDRKRLAARKRCKNYYRTEGKGITIFYFYQRMVKYVE